MKPFLFAFVFCHTVIAVFSLGNTESVKDIAVMKGGLTERSTKDSVPLKPMTGFDRFNKKAEALFKIIPVPIFSYSPEAGTVYGLAKFNVLNLSKKDTVSKASKLSEVATLEYRVSILILAKHSDMQHAQ